MNSTTLSPGAYFGELIETRNQANLILTQTHYVPLQVIPDHCHKQPYFCLTLDGHHQETFRSKNVDCVSKSVRFHPPESVHRNRFGDVGGRCFNIELENSWHDRLAEFKPDFEHAVLFNEGPMPFLAHRLYEEFHHQDELSTLAIEGIMLEIFSTLFRSFKEFKQTARWLRHVQSTLNERFLESVSLDELANIAGVHPVYLARAFRKSFGCSIGTYARKLRIEHAKKLLVSSNNTLGEIAIYSGFSDQSHFTRMFKAAIGMTPSQFRKSLQ